MATYSSSTPPPENPLPSTTSQPPVTTSSAPVPPPTTTPTTAPPTIFVASDTTVSTTPDINRPATPVTGGGGLPSSNTTTVTTYSPTPPPENKKTSSPRFTGPISRADSAAVVRPRDLSISDATFSPDVDDSAVDIVPAFSLSDACTCPTSIVSNPNPTITFTGPVPRTDSVAVVRPKDLSIPDNTFITMSDGPAIDIVPALIPVYNPVIGAPPVAPVDTSVTFDTNPDDPAVDIVPVLPYSEESAGIIANQYTSGGEFVLTTTGEDFIGYYHIHPDKGFMVGALHVNTPHEYLTSRSSVNVPEANTDTFYYDAFTLSYVGDDVKDKFYIQYRGISQGDDGNLYLIPYHAREVVRYDPSNNSQEKYNITTAPYNFANSTQKYVGSVLAPNGKIYTGAHSANSPLIIDTTQSQPVLSVATNVGTYKMQVRGPAYYNNRVYIPSFSGGYYWRVIDTETDEQVLDRKGTPIRWADPPRTDFIYRIRPNWEDEPNTRYNNGMKYDTNFGAVAGGNGKIYGIPFGASRINILDTTDNSTSWGLDEITGNAPMSNAADTDKATWFAKYKGGVLASNGCIYSHGTLARAILKIDTSDDSATEIPYPDAIIDKMTNGDVTNYRTPVPASFSSVLGSDGKVYSVPWGIPYIIWIDPADDSINYVDISSTLDTSGSERGDSFGNYINWYTYGTAVGNSIYYSPGGAERILKLTLNTPAVNSDGTDVDIVSYPGANDVLPDGAGVGIISFPDASDGGTVFDPETGPADIDNSGITSITDDTGKIINIGTDDVVGVVPVVNSDGTTTVVIDGVTIITGLGYPPTGSGTLPPPVTGTLPPPVTSTSTTSTTTTTPPPGTKLVCFKTNEENYDETTDDGANPAWIKSKVEALGGSTGGAINPNDTAFDLPVGAKVIDLIEVEIGSIKTVDPELVPDTKGNRFKFKVTINVPDGYDNYPGPIPCEIDGYSSVAGKRLVCYYDEEDGVDENGNEIVGANPIWNNAAANIVGANNITNLLPPSRIFNIPAGTVITPLIDLAIGNQYLVGVDPLVVPDLPGPLSVDLVIAVPQDQGFTNTSSVIECVMEMYPALSTTTTSTPPPPPPPPPPGLPLDECLLECLTFTTPLPPPPGRQRAVPVRLTIPFERTTIPPSIPLNVSTPSPEVPIGPSPTTPTTSTTTTTTTKDPCPPECDIPSF